MGDELSLEFGITNDAAIAAVDEVNKKLEETATDAAAATEAAKGTGAALADGAASAAPALDAVTTALDSTATAATAAAEAAGGVGSALVDGVAPAPPALDAVDAAAQRLQQTLAKLATDMANPASGPRVLMKDAAQAEIALKTFEQEGKAAGLSQDQLAKATAGASVAISDAATKAAVYNKALGEMRAQGVLAANQLEALRGGGASLSGMFQSMYKTGGDTTKAIGALGIGVGIAGMAITVAIAAGEKLATTLVKIIDASATAYTKQSAFADTIQGEALALAKADAGQVAYGNSLQDTAKNYEIVSSETSKSTGKLIEYTAALKGIGPAANFQQITQDVVKFGLALNVAFNKGATDAALFLAAHKGTIAQLAADWANAGKIIPADLQQIIDAMTHATAAQKLLSTEGAESVIASITKITMAKDVAIAADDKAALKASLNADKAIKDLNAETVGQEEYSKRKKAILEEQSASEDLAAAKSKLAIQQQVVAQLELQKSLALDDSAFGDAVKASNEYLDALTRGLPPTQAFRDAAMTLRTSIEAQALAVPKLNSSLRDLAEQGIKPAVDQVGALIDQHKKLQIEQQKVIDGTTKLGTVMGTLAELMPAYRQQFEDLTKAYNSTATAAQIAAVQIGDT